MVMGGSPQAGLPPPRLGEQLLRPAARYLGGAGCRGAGLSPKSLILCSSCLGSSSRAVFMSEDFASPRSRCEPTVAGPAAHDMSEPGGRAAGCCGFPNFYELAAFRETEFPG